MSQRYAVLEWEGSYEDGDGWVSVPYSNATKRFAKMMMYATPKGCTRKIVTMDELEESRRLNREDLPS